MAKKKKFQIDSEIDDVSSLPKSRSQKKRDSLALKDLGAELTKLSAGQLKHIPLNEDLQEAFKLMAKITDHEGRRRHLQYIGKLMRECDPLPIQEALAKLQAGHTVDNALLHHAERLRTALLTADSKEVATILAPWPEAAEELHTLILTAKAEQNPESQGAKRAIFRKLRELLSEK